MKNCTVCVNAQRKTIDSELLRGSPTLRDIARRCGLSKTALLRHKASHLPAQLARASEAAQLADAGELLQRLAKVCSDCERLQRTAEGAGDTRAALQALGLLGQQLQSLMRVGLEVERQKNAVPSARKQAEREVRTMTDAELADAVNSLLHPKRLQLGE
ncbi:MAG TPA: hypothetical protein VNF74_16250 [Terriglobales bacterium]|nr:hypothetical protein [Terriglobales bacterium]